MDGMVKFAMIFRPRFFADLCPLRRTFRLAVYSNKSNGIVFKKSGEEEFSSSECFDHGNLSVSENVIINKSTSFGRCVKTSKKLDFLNNNSYAYEIKS